MEKIKTERLLLTEWTLSQEDIEGLYEAAQDPKVGPPAGWKPHESKEESRNIIETLFVPHQVWAIREKETGRIIGSIGLEEDRRRDGVASRELGYWLRTDCWGKGYMTEAAKAVIDYAFSRLNLTILAICTGPENRRSQRVIEKCGFSYEGRQRKGYHIYDGSDRDNLLYSLLREEWEKL